ncbi:MAG: hypothetical protein Q8S54_12790 [Bacteroidota bacterium]|nr:hypothetical protein [Odoribacter sp.]MDP3644055.1 hypothetical protein [Bacteroidota bacterium]
MKIKFYKTGGRFLIIGAFLLNCFIANAQFTETREFVRRFKIQPETRIDITNKYGRIELNNWKKDSVVIFFKMEINEKKPIKLAKTLDNLDFDFSNSQHYLIVKTMVDKNRSQIESEFLKFKETILQTNGSIRIDLIVWMPENRELRLENKFGDIIMGDYDGETEINLSNGKLKCGDLPKRANLNLSFAGASINNMPNARIISNYSDINIRNSGTLRLETKSSTIEILNSNDLSIDSRRDKYRIRIADKLDAYGNFSHFTVSEFKNKANIRLSYGSLDMEKIHADFNNIYVESRSADLSLYFNPEAKFNFQITESKTDLKLGRELKVEDMEVLDSKENKVRHSGYFGKKMKEDQLIINAVGGETNVLSY